MRAIGIVSAVCTISWLGIASAARSAGDPSALPAAAAGGESSLPAESALAETSSVGGATARGSTFRGFAPPVDSERPYFVTGGVELRMLAVTDRDPANDRSLLWSFKAGYELIPKGSVFASIGLLERFVAEEGESGFRLQDARVGFDYAHAVDLSSIGARDRTLDLVHRVSVILPVSRESRAQDLRLAPEVLSRARVAIVDRLIAGLDGMFQYRFHRFAERAGLLGGMNTELVIRGLALLEYTVFDVEIGVLTAGADLHTSWAKKYSSRDDHTSPSGDAEIWLPDYGWDAYLVYAPIPELWISVSLEQNGQVLRDGIVNTFFVHRDETELVFGILGRY